MYNIISRNRCVTLGFSFFFFFFDIFWIKQIKNETNLNRSEDVFNNY